MPGSKAGRIAQPKTEASEILHGGLRATCKNHDKYAVRIKALKYVPPSAELLVGKKGGEGPKKPTPARQVPTRSGARSLRNQAITDSAVISPVFGFSDGMFSIAIENGAQPYPPPTRCLLRVSAGSAQISSRVRSGPM